MTVYTINELRNKFEELIQNGYGEQKVKINDDGLEAIGDENNDDRYSEKQIRDAVWELNRHYQDSIVMMDFHDLLLIENDLMNFERILFCGDVNDDCEIKGQCGQDNNLE